jgi:hypothetical protein
VDEDCEYLNLIEAAPQGEFVKNCFSDSFETPLVNSIDSNELEPDAKISDFSSLLDFSQILEEEQVVVAKKLPRSKKKFVHAYSDATKLELKQPSTCLTCASIEPRDTFTVDVPSKLSVRRECEIIKFFERHKTKRKALHDRRLSRKLLNSSKKVSLHASKMICAKGRNYSFGGSRSGG